MFAEYLRFRVALADADAFRAHNARWRAALAGRDGYLGQETLRHAEEPETWLVVVRWRDRAAMVAFPDAVQEELDAAGKRFSALVRADHFERDEIAGAGG